MKTKNQHQPRRLLDKSCCIFFLSAVFGLAGCQQNEGPAEQAGKKIDQAITNTGNKIEDTKDTLGQKAEKVGGYMDDSAITAKINAEILSDPLLKVSQINVSTANGVVKLSGVVNSQQSVNRVLEIVRSNSNVKSVENNLTVQ